LTHSLLPTLVFTVLIGIAAIGCTLEEPLKPANEIFEEILKAQGVPFKLTDEGTCAIELDGQKLVISLANVEKNYLRDKDPQTIRNFAATILTFPTQPPDTWVEAKSGIRFSLEPSDYKFGDVLLKPLTPLVNKVAIYVDQDTTKVTWLTPTHLENWQITEDELYQTANENMSALARKTEIVTATVASSVVGYFESSSIFKASLIVSPNIREQIPNELGWPVLVVIPARDFAYFLPEGDDELLGRVGKVVVREYTQSGYPITTEVLRLSDDGIEAIGAYQVP
jgi:hypothetical protein